MGNEGWKILAGSKGAGAACLRAPEVRDEGSKTGQDPRYV
jgi:hypothetical protein